MRDLVRQVSVFFPDLDIYIGRILLISSYTRQGTNSIDRVPFVDLGQPLRQCVNITKYLGSQCVLLWICGSGGGCAIEERLGVRLSQSW